MANGTGVRTSIFVSGCNNHCKGCFNQEAWNFNFGNKLTDEGIEELLTKSDKPFVKGLSILGGEPLDFQNYKDVEYLIDKWKEKFGNTKDIWLWTGFIYEDLLKDERKSVLSKTLLKRNKNN